MLTLLLAWAVGAGSPAESKDALAARCPLGDHQNVSVYDFLKRELVSWKPKKLSRAAVRELVAREAARPKDQKPLRASVVETQLSNVLTALCGSEPTCVSTALYDPDGVAVALSAKAHSIDLVAVSDDAQWASMTKHDPSSDGRVVPLSCADAQVLGVSCTEPHWVVSFSVFNGDDLVGVARCVIGKKPDAR